MGDPECAWNPAADGHLNGGGALRGVDRAAPCKIVFEVQKLD